MAYSENTGIMLKKVDCKRIRIGCRLRFCHFLFAKVSSNSISGTNNKQGPVQFNKWEFRYA